MMHTGSRRRWCCGGTQEGDGGVMVLVRRERCNVDPGWRRKWCCDGALKERGGGFGGMGKKGNGGGEEGKGGGSSGRAVLGISEYAS